jgi:MFS family permease
MTFGRGRVIAYWVCTGLFCAAMAAGGVQDILHTQNVVELFTQLRYPLYLATILGVCKLAGALALVAPKLPRLKEWAYAGFTFDLLGAAASAAVVGGMIGRIIFPLAFFALLIPSYLLRPVERRVGHNT